MGRRKTRRQTIKKDKIRFLSKRGGRRLGKGVTGIVYSPVLACENGSDVPYKGPGFVGKAIPETSIKSEIHDIPIAELREYADFIILPLHYCLLNETQTNENYIKNIVPTTTYTTGPHIGRTIYYNYQVIYRNGGQSALELLTADRSNHGPIINAIRAFITKLLLFNRKFIHSDLHLGNIVFDGSVIRMIDLETIERVNTENNKNDMRILAYNIYTFLERYTKDNANDKTYINWLAKYIDFKNAKIAHTYSINQIIEMINDIPTDTPLNEVVVIEEPLINTPRRKRKKCTLNGCTIMG